MSMTPAAPSAARAIGIPMFEALERFELVCDADVRRNP
jgi:hypothetical protein